MQEKIEKGEVDIVVEEEVVDITTDKKVPSIQDYLKDSLGKINIADIGKEANSIISPAWPPTYLLEGSLPPLQLSKLLQKI